MAEVEEMAALPSNDCISLDAIRSKLRELRDMHRKCKEEISSSTNRGSSDDLLNQCALEIEREVRKIVPECSVLSDTGPDDFDVLQGHLEEELNAHELQKIKLSDAMKDLTKSILADSNALEHKLEGLEYSLDLLALQALEKQRGWADDPWNSTNLDIGQKFEILEFQSKIEKKKIVLDSLQHIDGDLKRYEAIEQIEDALTDLKIIDIYENSIRLSLTTYIPKFEGYTVNYEDTADSLKVDHEMLIAFGDGNVGLSSVEIFPNDVSIVDIIDTAMAFRDSFPRWSACQSSLEWLVRKIQERIRLATLRRLAVKNANGVRYSAEYLDREGTIAVHMTSGIVIVVKVPQDWPLSDSPLRLTSMHSSEPHSRRVSENQLLKVQEVANSLDAQRRLSLSTFLEDIEKMLSREM